MIIQSQTAIYIDQQKIIATAVEEMVNELKLTDHNKQVYAEIVKDLGQYGTGLFSFTLRVNAGEIVDYVLMDNLLPDTQIND